MMIIRVLAAFLSIFSSLNGSTVYLALDYFWSSNPSFYQTVLKKFADEGIQAEIVNWADVQNDSRYAEKFNDENVKYVLLLSYKKYLDEHYFDIVPPKKRAFLIFEPPVVYPEQYTPIFFDRFEKILTFADCFVDNIKFYKYRYGSCEPMIDNPVDFNARTLACLINANKSWNHPLDLTELRRAVVMFYEKKPKDIFHLYGHGWPHELKNYKGPVDNKIEKIKYYKFCYCFENTKDIAGYITEKIFDCFCAGIVPIYYGAPNIADEIPKGCYIDLRDFSSIADLHQHISRIDKSQFNLYLSNIKQYLSSDAAQQYTVEAFAESIVKALRE